jgi:hypothetical protein
MNLDKQIEEQIEKEMNINKQIDEMAKTLCEDYGECKKCTLSNPECESPCMVREDCERLYYQGYRKASDVAREIIKDLVKFADDKERQMSFHGHSVWYIDADDVTDFIAKLKKKYEVNKE